MLVFNLKKNDIQKNVPPIFNKFFSTTQFITVPVHEIIIFISVQSSTQSACQIMVGFGWEHVYVNCVYPSVVQ